MKTKMIAWLGMFAALSSPLFADQLLTNNDFSAGLTGWSTAGTGFTATPGSDQWGYHVNVNITNGGTNPWDVKLYQDGITLEPGYEYVLEWGATRAGGSVNVGLGMSTDPYTDYLSDQISFSGAYLEHTAANGQAAVLHYCGEAVSGLRFYVDMGGNNQTVNLAWVSLGKNAKACDGSSSSSSALTNPGTGPVPYYGALKVSGNKIIGARSKLPVQVHGMSLYWSVWGGERFYNADAVKTLMTDWKCEVVRAAMGVDVGGGYASDPSGQQALVESVIQAAIANQIYVLVDFHSSNAENYSSQAKTFFSAMAQKYGKNDNVIFEIYNEPLNIPWSTVKNYAVGVIAEIRKYSSNLVIVGTPNWSQDVDAASTDKINDPNVAYTLHFYAGSHGSDLMAKARTAMNNGAALFITEWGTVNSNGDGGVATSSSNAWMAFADQYKLSWANWSLNDKAEGASAFQSGISTTGSGWTNMGNVTSSGQYVYSKLTGYAASEPWRTAPKVVTPPTAIKQNSTQPVSQLSVNAVRNEYSLAVPMQHHVSLTNLRGQIVWQANQQEASGAYSFGNARLTSGVYLLHIKSQNMDQSMPVMMR